MSETAATAATALSNPAVALGFVGGKKAIEAIKVGQPQLPGAPELPAPPGDVFESSAQAEVEQARDAQRDRRRGRASTILTGGQGVTLSTGTRSSRVLLGN